MNTSRLPSLFLHSPFTALVRQLYYYTTPLHLCQANSFQTFYPFSIYFAQSYDEACVFLPLVIPQSYNPQDSPASPFSPAASPNFAFSFSPILRQGFLYTSFWMGCLFLCEIWGVPLQNAYLKYYYGAFRRLRTATRAARPGPGKLEPAWPHFSSFGGVVHE